MIEQKAMFIYNLVIKTKGVIHMAFGEKLFKLRKEKGLSQEDLAEKLNTSRQAISKWENGQGFPETEKLLVENEEHNNRLSFKIRKKVREKMNHL